MIIDSERLVHLSNSTLHKGERVTPGVVTTIDEWSFVVYRKPCDPQLSAVGQDRLINREPLWVEVRLA